MSITSPSMDFDHILSDGHELPPEYRISNQLLPILHQQALPVCKVGVIAFTVYKIRTITADFPLSCLHSDFQNYKSSQEERSFQFSFIIIFSYSTTKLYVISRNTVLSSSFGGQPIIIGISFASWSFLAINSWRGIPH